MNKCDVCPKSHLKDGVLKCPYDICVLSDQKLLNIAHAISSKEAESQKNTDTNTDFMEIVMEFTIDEIVKLFSCCNQAIICIEDQIYLEGIDPNASFSNNGVTLKRSIDKIYEIKSKINKAIIKSLGESPKNSIKILLDITEYIKLNGCCNSAIDSYEKTIELLPMDSHCIISCKENIQEIRDIKTKIKSTLNAIYGDKVDAT